MSQTPTEDLVLEVLAARYRLGEKCWTFANRYPVLRAIRSLADAGLVSWKHGVVENTVLAWLTDAGRAEAMDPNYVSPTWPSDEVSS